MGPKMSGNHALSYWPCSIQWEGTWNVKKFYPCMLGLVDRQHGLDSPVASQLRQISVDGWWLKQNEREHLKK